MSRGGTVLNLETTSDKLNINSKAVPTKKQFKNYKKQLGHMPY
jgi:hypothetical protein